MKKNFYVGMFTAVILSCLFLTACGTSPQKKPTEQSTVNTETSTDNVVTSTENTEMPTSGIPKETEPKENDTEVGTDDSETELTEEITSAETDASETNILKKVNVYTDEVGIYSVIIELNDRAADKAVIEMVYTGATGTAEEGSIVNTFRIEYYKDTTGKYEISTFFNGNVDLNYHQKDNVKIENTFGAATRAADVIITYTPDGGETEEIFRGLANDYR